MPRRFKLFIAILGLALALSGAALAQAPALIDGKDVLPYLNQVIDWQRRLGLLEVPAELPRVQLIRNTLRQHTAKAVTASFTVAHAVADTLPPQAAAPAPDAPADGKGRNIQKAIARSTQQVRDLQTALAAAHDGAHRRALDGQLKLAQEHLSLLKTVATAVGAQDEQNDSLADQIDKLAATVPEADGGTAKQAALPPAAATPAPESAGGVAGVASDLYGYIKDKQKIKALRNETQQMLDDNRNRSRTLRDAVQSLMAQGVEIGKAAAPNAAKPDPKAPPAPKAPTYDDLLSDMKQVSAIAAPLSELNMALDASVRDLNAWSDALSFQIRDVSRRLFWRLGMMGVSILGLFVLSYGVGRATRRYVLDERRQVQLRTFRKLVLLVSIAVVIFLGFFTDLTSLATFAGLITAGLAVALQTVILSVVAFFHFFGSFGIRVGDRITIQNVTGRVMQIGMTRFYLMELDRSDVGFLPTGRIVGFPNSILFQPLPFFRQVPGTNFVWSEIKLTLDPKSDHEAMYKKISDVVTRVYKEQRDIIQTQELALHNITRFKMHMAEPQLYLRITGAGILLTIRYAVQREQETELHLRMTEELLAVIKKDPDLKFVGVG